MSEKWKDFAITTIGSVIILAAECAWICLLVYLMSLIPIVGWGLAAVFMAAAFFCMLYLSIQVCNLYYDWYDKYC